MFDIRMLLIKLRHSTPVRAFVQFPDRVDDALLRRADRVLARFIPFFKAGMGRAWTGLRRIWDGSDPFRRLVLAAWTRAVRLLDRVPLSCWTGLLMTVMVVVPARIDAGRVAAICNFSGVLPAQLKSLPAGSVDVLFQSILVLSRILIVVLPLAALTAFVRRRFAHVALKAGAAGFLLLTIFLWQVVIQVPSLLNSANAEVYPNAVRNELWVAGGWRVAPWLVFALVLIVTLARRPLVSFYGGNPDSARWADRLWANVRTHGADPGFRKTLYMSSGLHFFLIFILPFLLFWAGCNELPYGIPLGSGTPTIETVKIRKVKKKPEKKYVLNMNTAVSFYVPKIEDSAVLEELDKETENTYEAQALGKLGAGGGKTGGWPNGMKNSRVRFIRLEYDGGDWDQDMGYGADYNILLKFRELTGFDIASETESRPIAQLKRFPKNRAPPFVYLTGGLRGTMNISQTEVKILREYCLDMGGLLFVDNGGGRFDPQFRGLAKRVFPDLRLVEIAKDDVIFQQPFLFPAGAPALWHHSGNNAMGIKYKGRWVVFYHQGDINDAWKTGHSGATPGVAMQAYKLGVNVINYAFNQYMFINFGGVVPK